MVFVLIYLIVFLIVFLKVLKFKEAFQKTMVVGVLCAFGFFIVNFCFNNMENFRNAFTDREVYEIADINKNTIVYVDKDNNLAVITKDNVEVIKNDHTIQSWLTCMRLKKAGKALVVEEFPEDWEAYIAPKDN